MADLTGIQQAVQKIADQALKDQAKSGLDKGVARPEDVQKLQDALNQAQQAEANAANGVSPAQAPDKVAGVQGIEQTSPGNKILESVHRMRSGLQAEIAQLNTMLSKSDFGSPADMLRVQAQLQQVTMQQDLLGKVVSKSEQNIETLLKGQ